MTTLAFHPLRDQDLTPYLALNNAHPAEVGPPLSEAGLRRLVDGAFVAVGQQVPCAFLVAFDHDATYESPNFRWFRDRHQRFVYIDRVLVAAEARGMGLARCLYDRLVERATLAGHTTLCCEVSLDPPNPGSLAFHATLGFAEVGRAVLDAQGKTVAYLVRTLRTAGIAA